MYVHDDVRTLTAGLVRERCGRLPSVIVGSPPCQDASCANAGGKGVDGERTGLFFEAIRVVGECRPVWGCFENVPGLRGRGLDRVLCRLEAEGYAVWPLVMGADDFGAPHRRKRLWIVFADLSGDGRGSGVARRSDPGAAGARKRAFYGAATDLDATREPMGVAGQPRAERLGDPADAGCLGAGHGPASPRLVASGDAGAQGPRSGGDVRHPDGAGLAVGEGERGDAFAQLPPVVRAIAERSGWNGGQDGLARGLRMASRIRAWMAYFGSTRSFREWLNQGNLNNQKRASGVAWCFPEEGLTDVLKIMASFPDEDFVRCLAQITGQTRETVDTRDGTNLHHAKPAHPKNGLKSTTLTATGQITPLITCKPFAGGAIDPTTCEPGTLGGARRVDAKFNELARAIIAAYGDAIVPQIAEAIGRSMMRLCPTDGAVLDLFAGAAGGWSLGMERAGYTVIAACEIDPWRRAVIEGRDKENAS